MPNFKNMQEFEKFIGNVVEEQKIHEEAMLKVMASYVEDAAKRKFGHYQESAGPFQNWLPLKQITMEDRVRKGFSPNDPLYRTGDLMHSIYHKVKGNKAVIGSDEIIMLYQEVGTFGKHPIPERSTLGAAMFQSKKVIQKIAAEGLVNWITGKKPNVSYQYVKKG